MFSILIPTNSKNIEYLNLCLKSIKKNSKYKHEILVHVNDCKNLNFSNLINFEVDKLTQSEEFMGLCKTLNKISQYATKDYLVYCHDDMYFSPGWDEAFKKNINVFKKKKFILSGTMVQQNGSHINFDCGDSPKNFNEVKFLNNFKNVNYYDFQGTTWAPTLIPKNLWKEINGLSEEFDPGFGSDPDMNMKLWKRGIRVFKGINDCKVYHFGSVTLRKNKNVKKNKSSYIFLKKWGFSIKFFKKYYMRSDEKFDGDLPLSPKKNIAYYYDLLKCKIIYFYLRLIK